MLSQNHLCEANLNMPCRCITFAKVVQFVVVNSCSMKLTTLKTHAPFLHEQ